MSNFTKEQIDYYADKLLIGLTEEEMEEIDIETLLRNCDQYEGREVEVPKVVG